MTAKSHDCARSEVAAVGKEDGCIPKLQNVPAPYVFSDYAQWERRPTSQRRLVHTCVPLSLKQLAPIESRRPSISLQARASNSRRQARPPEQVSVKLLRFQIADRSRSLGCYRAYREFLQAENNRFMERIEEMEDKSHHNTKELLERYRKFKTLAATVYWNKCSGPLPLTSSDQQELVFTDDTGALAKLKEKSSETLAGARDQLEVVQSKTQANSRALERELINMDFQLQVKLNELQVLITYKEKEYPVKLVKIEQLKEQCEAISETHQREENELQKSLTDQQMMFQQTMETTRIELEALATKEWLSKMKKSAVERAIQNRIMEKELKFHKLKARELVADIQHLKAAIRRIKDADHQCSVYSHTLSILGKCSPDADLQLDIPMQEKLPV